MLLMKIEIENFRQFGHTSYDFMPGITAITGLNGSGKTSFLEAITWCLFGEQRDKKETLRNIWSSTHEKTSVGLTFSLSGSIYSVLRTENDATLKRVSPNSKVLATKLRPVTTAVEKLLGMTYEQFKNSYLTEQKDLRFLQFSSALRQKDEIAKMLGFDRLGSAAKMAKEIAKRQTSQSQTLSAAVGMAANYDKELRVKAEEHKQSKLKLQGLEATSSELQEKVKLLEMSSHSANEYLQLKKEIDTRKTIGNSLKEQKQNCENRLNDAKKSFAERETLKPEAEKFEQTKKSIEAMQNAKSEQEKKNQIEKRMTMIRQEIGTFESIIKQFSQPSLEECEKLYAETELSLENKQRELNEVEAQERKVQTEQERKIAALETQIANEVKERDKKSKALDEGKCPTCGKEWTAKDRQMLEELDERIKDLNKTLEQVKEKSFSVEKPNKLRADICNLNDSLNSLNEKLSQLRIKQQQSKDAEKLLNDKKHELAQLDAESKQIKFDFDPNQLIQLQTLAKSLEPKWKMFQQLAGVTSQIKSYEDELSQLNSKFQEEKLHFQHLTSNLEKFELDSEKANLAIDEHRKAVNELSAHLLKVKEESTRIEEQKKAIELLTKTVEEYKSQKELYETTLKSAELHKQTEEALSALRELLSEQAKPLIENFASNYLQSLTSGRYSRLILNEKYEATVFDESYQKPVISGGEEDIVALSLRLALAQMIQERSGQPMGLLMLDEVFGSLDSDRRINVMDQIDSLRNTFDQILVISHIDTINESADRCIEVRYNPQTKKSQINERIESFAIQ